MKVILVLLSIIQTGILSAYQLEPVQDLPGIAELVSFDSDGNTYVAAVTGIGGDVQEHKIHKLSPDNEHLWSVPFPSWVERVLKMVITKEKDIYFILNYFPNATLAILKSDSQTVEIVEQIRGNVLLFLDEDDNLLYERQSGVSVLRPGSSAPVAIKNLENSLVAIVRNDQYGNIYLGIVDNGKNVTSIALITKQQLQNDVPEAEIFDVVDNENQKMINMALDKENNLWICLVEESTDTGLIKKLENGTVSETIVEEYSRPNILAVPANDRIYVVAAHTITTASPAIYYITLDKQIVKIPALEDLPEQDGFYPVATADRDGNAYFASTDLFAEGLGYMFMIKPGEETPISIPTFYNQTNGVVTRMDLDSNEDVWLITTPNYIYYIKRGSAVANEIQNFNDPCIQFYSNPVTKNVYVTCESGLYVTVDD